MRQIHREIQEGQSKSAFTIIEVLVSVVLISIVVLAIIKIQQKNRSMALYISDRDKVELSNTLFMGDEIEKYHKDKKDAYTLLSQRFKISDLESRTILKKIERDIYISDPIVLSDDTLPVEINELLLKGDYSSRFIHLKSK